MQKWRLSHRSKLDLHLQPAPRDGFKQIIQLLSAIISSDVGALAILSSTSKAGQFTVIQHIPTLVSHPIDMEYEHSLRNVGRNARSGACLSLGMLSADDAVVSASCTAA